MDLKKLIGWALVALVVNGGFATAYVLLEPEQFLLFLACIGLGIILAAVVILAINLILS